VRWYCRASAPRIEAQTIRSAGRRPTIAASSRVDPAAQQHGVRTLHVGAAQDRSHVLRRIVRAATCRCLMQENSFSRLIEAGVDRADIKHRRANSKVLRPRFRFGSPEGGALCPSFAKPRSVFAARRSSLRVGPSRWLTRTDPRSPRSRQPMSPLGQIAISREGSSWRKPDAPADPHSSRPTVDSRDPLMPPLRALRRLVFPSE